MWSRVIRNSIGPLGKVRDVWVQNGVLYIRYKDGAWYHYQDNVNGLE